MSDYTVHTQAYTRIAYELVKEAARTEKNKRAAGLFQGHWVPEPFIRLQGWNAGICRGFRVPGLTSCYAKLAEDGEVVIECEYISSWRDAAIWPRRCPPPFSLQRLRNAIRRAANRPSDQLAKLGSRTELLQYGELLYDWLRGKGLEAGQNRWSGEDIAKVVGTPLDPFKQGLLKQRKQELQDWADYVYDSSFFPYSGKLPDEKKQEMLDGFSQRLEALLGLLDRGEQS